MVLGGSGPSGVQHCSSQASRVESSDSCEQTWVAVSVLARPSGRAVIQNFMLIPDHISTGTFSSSLGC